MAQRSANRPINGMPDRIEQIAESENFPIEKIGEFVVFIQNEPYIT